MSAEEPKSTQPMGTPPSWTGELAAPPGGEASPLRITPGDRIGPYQVLQLLGEGGFGAVYLCEQVEPVRRRVAVKVIKAGMDTADVVARFRAERQALAMMEHPSIAKVFEAGATDGGRPYFVMEYVKGVPISEYCSEHRLDLRARLELFARVCDAVQHAHQKGVIHRDLKPGNILVGTNGGREPAPKIIDFGVAKATSQHLTEQTIFTQLGQMIGTPMYMSPEQAGVSSEDIDTRSDVYSLGVILYQLICGRLPFDPELLRERGILEMQRVIREEDPPRPSTRLSSQVGPVTEESTRIALERKTSLPELTRTLKRELEWIPLKALRKNRTERYSTAEGLANDVRRYLAGDVLEAGPESASYRLRKLVRRHRVPVIAAALVSLSLVVGLVASVAFAMETAEANVRAQKALLAASAAQAESEEQAALAREQARLAEKSRTVAEEKTAEASAAALALEKQRDAAELEAERASELAGFLQEILTSVDPGTARTLDKELMLQVLGNAVARLDAGTVGLPEVEVQLRGAIAEALENIHDFQGALDQQERVQVLETQLRGEDDPDAIAVGLARGRLLNWMGQSEEAVELFTATRDRLLEIEGADHTLTEVANGYLAGALLAVGRVDEAIEMEEQLVQRLEARLGSDHPETLNALRGLCLHYANTEQHERRMALWQEYRGRILPELGPDDPEVLYVDRQLAAVYRARGELEEAFERFEELLPRYEATFGADHPESSELLSDLGLVSFNLERHEVALEYLSRARALQVELYGPAHFYPIVSGSGMSACLRLLGRLEEAAALQSELLELHLVSKHFGPTSPRTLDQVRRTLALLLELEEASPEAERAAKIERYRALEEELAAEIEGETPR